MTQDLIEIFKEQLAHLDEARIILQHSYEQCQQLGQKDDYSMEELDRIEAFTSRFARMSDLLIQQIFRLIDKLDLEDQGTVRDRIHRAEKKGLIVSAEHFTEIRILRNQIAHEYLPDAMTRIYENVLELCPELFESVERVKRYSEKFFEATDAEAREEEQCDKS